MDHFRWTCQLDSPTVVDDQLLGNKTAVLIKMIRLGLPVPPGFTLTTKAWRRFNQKKELPQEIWQETLSQLKILERKTVKQFGHQENPLIVSVRSGSKYSMPGMMETILNVGLNQKTIKGLSKRLGEDCAQDSWTRLKKIFKKTVGQEPPQDPYKQLKLAIEAVFSSWNNPQAQIYRKYNAIPQNIGTSAAIQEMVFGNIPDGRSGAGVFFTRDPRTGQKKPSGEFALSGQGEDVVQEKQRYNRD